MINFVLKITRMATNVPLNVHSNHLPQLVYYLKSFIITEGKNQEGFQNGILHVFLTANSFTSKLKHVSSEK